MIIDLALHMLAVKHPVEYNYNIYRLINHDELTVNDDE